MQYGHDDLKRLARSLDVPSGHLKQETVACLIASGKATIHGRLACT